VEVPVVHPNVLRELELPNEAPTDHERRDAPLLPVVWRVLREIGSIGCAPTDHAPTIGIRGGIARGHAAYVGTQGHGVTLRFLAFIVEIIVALRISSKRGVVLFRCETERRAAAPAAHQFRCEELLLLACLGVPPQEISEFANVLLESPVSHEAAVAG